MKESWLRFQDSFLKLIGLRPYNTVRLASDPYNIFEDSSSADDRRALRVAVFVAIVFHIILFVIRFATVHLSAVPENKQLITLRNIVGPPSVAGGGQTKSAPKKLEVPKPKPQPMPFPDPTPDEPEPLYEIVPDPAPEIVAQVGSVLSIGEVIGPPGPGGYGGNNKGPGVGPGPGGPGDGVYSIGGGVRAPVPIMQPLPPYTEDARKARIEGLVLIQAVVRKDGSVDSFKVVRGLGHGLDESTINTIANKWRFKPGTLNGAPVDVQANIEVSFRLY